MLLDSKFNLWILGGWLRIIPVAVVKFLWQAHALDLAKWLEQGSYFLWRCLKGHIADNDLGAFRMRVLFPSSTGSCSLCDTLPHTEGEDELMTIDHGALHNVAKYLCTGLKPAKRESSCM